MDNKYPDAIMPETKLKFEYALLLLKEGAAVQRAGWNGKGMFLYLVPENIYPAITDHAKKHFGDKVPYGSYIAMKTAQDNVVPWLASQTDILAEDWQVYHHKEEVFDGMGAVSNGLADPS